MVNRADLRSLKNFDANRGCFACGSHNPGGLHMDFKTDEERVFSWLRIPEHLCGWDGVAHGGIISTILDETMSWTAHHLLRKLILTQSIQVDFLRPVYTATELRSEGWILEVKTERKADLCAQLINTDEKLCARATGTFALLTPKIARRLGVMQEEMIASFERFLNP